MAPTKKENKLWPCFFLMDTEDDENDLEEL
jgi:hypothetical protein